MVSETKSEATPVGEKTIPEFAKPRTTDFWMVKAWPETNWIPVLPELPPSMSRPRRLMTSPAPAWIVRPTPFVAKTPATALSLVMVTALLIVTGP